MVVWNRAVVVLLKQAFQGRQTERLWTIGRVSLRHIAGSTAEPHNLCMPDFSQLCVNWDEILVYLEALMQFDRSSAENGRLKL